MIQGLNTNGIHGAAVSLAYMYRIFAKEYKVYLFDRRNDIGESITVRELASDIATAMDALGLKNADIFGVSQGGMIAQSFDMRIFFGIGLRKNNCVSDNLSCDKMLYRNGLQLDGVQ